MDRAEEQELTWRWWNSRDRFAGDRLARAHQGQVLAFARKYRHYGLPVDDLIAEGNFGMVQALNRFDPARGLRFMTYAAHWIRATIVAHILDSWSIVSSGGSAMNSKVFFKLRRERERAIALLGEGPAAERALAARMGVSDERLQTMLRCVERRDVSITLCPEERAELCTAADQESGLSHREEHSLLARSAALALSALDARERYVTERRCMVDAEDALSLAEIGRRLGISRERARQIEERAKRKLRMRLYAAEL